MVGSFVTVSLWKSLMYMSLGAHLIPFLSESLVGPLGPTIFLRDATIEVEGVHNSLQTNWDRGIHALVEQGELRIRVILRAMLAAGGGWGVPACIRIDRLVSGGIARGVVWLVQETYDLRWALG